VTRALALQLLLSLLLFSLVAATVVLPRLRRAAVLAERLRALGGRPGTVRPGRHALAGMLRRIGGGVLSSGVLGAEALADLRRSVVAAGFRSPAAVAVFVGAKASLFLLLPMLVWATTHGADNRPLMVAAAAVAGLMGPDFALRSVRARHLKAVSRGLPDALDLLVICAEAGLPLEAAVDRVATETEGSSPAVSAELSLTATELRILSDRRTALLNMGARTGLESLKRLGSTLAQTLQYGTPLTQALRVLAAELRHEALMGFEARAARLPALLTLPTILFILPCLFLVVGGPAALRVIDLFSTP